MVSLQQHASISLYFLSTGLAQAQITVYLGSIRVYLWPTKIRDAP